MVLPSISSVLSSRKRTTATSNTTAASTQSSTKRARRQRNEVETAMQTLSSEVDTSSSPPSLELSHTFTFESSSSRSSPTSSIENNDDDNDHTTTEYYTALSAHAKQRIHTAQLLETQSKENLIRAQIQYQQSTAEFQNAVQFYNGVEKRQWGGVIDDVGSASSCGSSGSELEMSSSCNNDVKEIQISQAGLSICNGVYKLDTTTITTQRGPIYTHTEGPITIQNDELYDMCIFQRYGYGDKIRWCIGLVPHHPTSLVENDEVETVAMYSVNEQLNDQLFQRAYIYYWKEVDAIINTTNMHDTLLLQNDSSSWGVCHGTRPLPILTNISGNRKWWQFWKA